MSITVNFAWNANSEPDIAGYRIYAGPSTGVYTDAGSPKDMGNVTSGSYSVPSAGQWFFALTAYNTAQLESGFSAELQYGLTSAIRSGFRRRHLWKIK